MFTPDKIEIGFVGQPLQLDSECTVHRAPAGATAQVVDGALTPDAPGVWQVERHGAQQKIVIYPREALEAPSIAMRAASYAGHERPHTDRIGILRSIARHVDEPALDAMTPERPLPVLPRGTSLATYGGDHGQ